MKHIYNKDQRVLISNYIDHFHEAKKTS